MAMLITRSLKGNVLVDVVKWALLLSVPQYEKFVCVLVGFIMNVANCFSHVIEKGNSNCYSLRWLITSGSWILLLETYELGSDMQAQTYVYHSTLTTKTFVWLWLSQINCACVRLRDVSQPKTTPDFKKFRICK